MNNRFRDIIFRKYSNDKRVCADIYKTLTGVEVDLSEIEITTLEESPLLNRTNDLSFKVRGRHVLLVEEQSTYSANMAIRMLLYYAKLLDAELLKGGDRRKLYSAYKLELEPPIFALYRWAVGSLMLCKD